MPARRPTRPLLGVAAVLTVSALFGATLAVPAQAKPIDRTNSDLSARKLGNTKAGSIPTKWFVQVAGSPSLRGGNRTTAKARQASVQSAAKADGVKYSVLHSYSRVWNGFSVKASETEVNKLRAMSGVVAVYPVYKVTLPENTAKPELKYSLPMIGATQAQVEGYKGTGIKVGVIDTGIDYNHPDLGGSGVEGNNADFGPSAPRVKYGYDFAGDDYDADSTDPGAAPQPDPYPDDCNGHGTHVSGIIGANGDPSSGGAVGVAPEVTFGAYRVFGCEGSADTEVILAAMDRAAADGMDVVNMSLGSEFDSWPDYPEAAAASALTAAGTLVVAAAGNDGADGLFTAGTPSVGKDVISVGSVENTKSTNWVFTVSPKPAPLADAAISYIAAEGAPDSPTTGSGDLANANPLRACAPVTGVSGKIALVQRGDCSFYDKALAAQDAGATGVVIYNNEPGLLSPTVVGEEEITIPVVFIEQTDGEAIQTQLAEATATDLTWTDTTESGDNPLAGTISDFSTFGMAANLAMTPDVSAPGGNIFSTFPLEKKGYANLSGTSMATPHVAGAVALLLQAKASLKGDVNAVRTALQNTSTPIDKTNLFGGGDIYDGLYEPTIRQGAGLIHIDKAIAATLAATTVSPGKINLGENRSSYYKTTLKLTNNGSTTETYKLSVQNALNIGAAPTTYWYDYNDKKVSSKFSSSSVSVKAHKTATVSVYLKQPSLSTGWIYGGWVKLTKSDKSKTLVVPFTGMYGDYQKVKVLQDLIDVNQAGTALEVVADLPALSTSDDTDDIIAPTDPKHVFTMAGDDVPNLLFHLDYPVSAAYFNVYKATSTGKKGAEVFPGYKTFFQLGEYGRDNSFLDLTFDGKIPFSNSTASGLTVPDGDYVLEIRVLKALGKASTSSHWETYTTPAFTIDRTTG
jgi:subtilisin family serine protease